MRITDFLIGAKNVPAIYRITNKETGLFYVGSASRLFKRLAAHRNRLANGTHHNQHMLASFQKHGIEVFKFEVLEYVVGVDMLVEREQHWIDALDAVAKGYNKSPTAGSLRGVFPGASTRALMSKAHKGKAHVLTPEGRARMVAARKNFTLSAESRAKISATKTGAPRTQAQIDASERQKITGLGRKHTPEAIEKMRLWNTGRKMSAESVEKSAAALRGRKRTTESVEKSAAWHRGRKDTPGVVAQRAASNTGKTRTPEQRERIRAGQQAARERKKIEQAQIALT